MTCWRVGSGIGAVVGALGQVSSLRALELRLKSIEIESRP
jgi:hypothetical protein